MTAPDYYVYDGDPSTGVVPRRPSVDDLGGAAWEDDQKHPPDPNTMPYAAAFNQEHRVGYALARLTPVLNIAIRFAAGAPVIDYAVAAGPVALDVAVDLTLTDNAAGDTTITWPAASMPPTNMQPAGPFINEDVAIDETRVFRVAHGIRIITKMGGVATDAGCSVHVFGDW